MIRSRSTSATVRPISAARDAARPAGLLEAAAQVTVERRPVLVIAYDLPYPAPLSALWRVSHPFAVALLLVEPAHAGSPRIGVEIRSGASSLDWPVTIPRGVDNNPAAAALPLLALLARAVPGDVMLPYLEGCGVAVELRG